MLKVLLADDHQAFSDAVALRLQAEPDLRVVCLNGTEHLSGPPLTAADADVLVTDVQVGGLSAAEIAARARRTSPGLRVIVLTADEAADVAVQSLRAGAVGYLTKDTTIEQLVSAIRGTIRDETWISPRVLGAILRQLLAAPRPLNIWEEQISVLTTREREVLACMVGGMARSAIAKTLYLSPNTVRTHIQRVLVKLQVHSSLEAVAVALRANVRPYKPSE